MSVTYPAAADLPPRLTVTAVRGYQTQAQRMIDLLAATPGVANGGQSVGAGGGAGRGRAAAGRLLRQDRCPARSRHARGRGDGRRADRTAAHPRGQRERHGARSGHRVPARPADRGPAHPVGAQAGRRCPARRPGQPVPRGVQVAGRPDHADQGPRRLPARLSGHGRPGWSPRRADELGRSTITCSAAAPRRNGELVRGPPLGAVHQPGQGVAGRPGGPAARAGGPAVARLAADRIARAHRRVFRDGGAISATSPPESLHDLRKRCKELRYLLEFFSSLYEPADHWQAVRELKALQDCLGEFQDSAGAAG